MFSKGLKLTLGCIFILLVCVNDVYADSTPTPVPPYVPTIITGMQYVDENNTCPPGAPLYYQTKTPSPLWMLKCGHCLPENQPYITLTPAYTLTPTPFPANQYADIRGSTYSKYKLNGSGDIVVMLNEEDLYIDEDIALGYAYFNLAAGFESWISQNNSDYEVSALVDYEFTKNARTIGCGTQVTIRYKFTNLNADHITWDTYDAETNQLVNSITVDRGNTAYINIGNLDQCEAGTLTKFYYMNFIVDNATSTTNKIFLLWDDDVNFYWGTYSRKMEVNWYKGLYPVEVEPVESGCDEIVGEGEEEADQFGFEYSGITFGNTYCADIGGYEYSILGVDISVPYVAHLCAQEIGAGTITILGVILELDGFIKVLGIAWALRNLFIS